MQNTSEFYCSECRNIFDSASLLLQHFAIHVTETLLEENGLNNTENIRRNFFLNSFSNDVHIKEFDCPDGDQTFPISEISSECLSTLMGNINGHLKNNYAKVGVKNKKYAYSDEKMMSLPALLPIEKKRANIKTK